ncbi:MAG: 2-amino-4-hydroxy-6-hydroxymethyldihydropteridine diphosphokinase [Eubacterium sp.]|nr:2-amino-4-hydroxy-6-hydroxymethyldihydropteridine diphosphokinase [Eubacterium sp.]
MKYILSIGTNIGDRKANIVKCVDALSLLPKTKVLRCSRLYETEPVGYENQQSFYNIAAEVESSFDPHEMLGACLGIEAGFGRVRQFKNGPRIIDIDLIFAEDAEIKSENLILPHPRYSERRFVLEPLCDLFPNAIVYGTNIKPHIEALSGQEVKIID